jgi:hypothetical protein
MMAAVIATTIISFSGLICSLFSAALSRMNEIKLGEIAKQF